MTVLPMHLYSGFGLVIASELELAGLPAAVGDPDVTVCFGAVTRGRRPADVAEEVRVYRNTAAFRISHGREIVIDPMPEADITRIRVFLLGVVMAYLMRQRGWLPLHASAVSIDGKAALFMGASGQGKSTTAAAFHIQGRQFVSDDVCGVKVMDGTCWVQPAWSRIRLTAASRDLLENTGVFGELQVDKHSYCISATPLTAQLPVERIYLLEFGDRLEIKPVPLLEAVAFLSANSFSVRRQMSREALEVHVRDCAAVAGTTKLARLMRPESLVELPALVVAVENNMQKKEA